MGTSCLCGVAAAPATAPSCTRCTFLPCALVAQDLRTVRTLSFKETILACSQHENRSLKEGWPVSFGLAGASPLN